MGWRWRVHISGVGRAAAAAVQVCASMPPPLQQQQQSLTSKLMVSTLGGTPSRRSISLQSKQLAQNAEHISVPRGERGHRKQTGVLRNCAEL